MVTAKKVIWAESAKNDLQKIYNRIAGKSVDQAKTRVGTILETTAKLNTEYPKGLQEPLLRNEKTPYKYIEAGFYKVVYNIVEDTVIVKTIYHTRQEPVV